MTSTPITIAGAGLAGALLALMLRQRGFSVEVIEQRADLRSAALAQGRSINLALAERGRSVLAAAGVVDRVLDEAVAMPGRMIHCEDGSQQFQPYSADGESAIWSVSRGRLNRTLVQAAADAGVTFRFDTKLVAVDLAARTLRLQDLKRDVALRESFHCVIGADGAGSMVRTVIEARSGHSSRTEWLGHSYKELCIPARDGEFALRPDALHIWPRHDFMLIALPNHDRSFTCTLFLSTTGDNSFAALQDENAVRRFFEKYFASAIALMPDYLAQYAANPVGPLGTLYSPHWHVGAHALILGDAAHPIVPFHGQGMNAAFEDVGALVEQVTGSGFSAEGFATFAAERKPQADAIAVMALENYAEMRDAVADPMFQLRKKLEHELTRRYPAHYRSRYELISFTTTPYAQAQRRGWQNDVTLAALLPAFVDGSLNWDTVPTVLATVND